MIHKQIQLNKYDPPSDPYGYEKRCKICDAIMEIDNFTGELVCRNCENEEIICPDCDGSGEVACEGWFNSDGMTTCERCNGTGRISES